MRKQPKSEIVMVRLTPADKAAVEAAAVKEEMSVSEYMRAATLVYMSLRLDRHALRVAVAGAKAMVQEATERVIVSQARKPRAVAE